MHAGKATARPGVSQKEADRRPRKPVRDFRIRCFFAITGTVDSPYAASRNRKTGYWVLLTR
ncbi:hypothetical protein HMPREF9404_5371 [Eggerthella sp. HGA1]|nr:hypothetical protein HMPREF9404_5371 [Eggerthella sp. HGA1]